MCVRQNLAYAEMYDTIATVITKFPDLRLWDTSERDMELVYDYFEGLSGNGNRGLKVKIGKAKSG